MDVMSDSLARQRRNLMAISCILWFLNYGFIQITTFTFADAEFTIGNPSSVYIAVWLLYFYFLFRYLVYFISEGQIKAFYEYKRSIDHHCNKRLQNIYRQHYGEAPSELASEFSIFKLERSNYFNFRLYKAVKPALNDDEFSSISVFLLIIPYIKGILSFIVLNRAFTDYILPFLLALIALVYGLASEWPGNLLNFF